jgi:hypothetical protein
MEVGGIALDLDLALVFVALVRRGAGRQLFDAFLASNQPGLVLQTSQHSVKVPLELDADLSPKAKSNLADGLNWLAKRLARILEHAEHPQELLDVFNALVQAKVDRIDRETRMDGERDFRGFMTKYKPLPPSVHAKRAA